MICLLIAVGITASYNWLRFGDLFETGYHEASWDNPPLFGLYGLLVSPGKGVLFYAPILILSLAAGIPFFQRYKAETSVILGLWICFLGFYAPYNYWTGGFNWGPRFLMPVLPLSILPLGTLLEDKRFRGGRLAFFVLVCIGLVLQTSAILVDHSRYLYLKFEASDVTSAYSQTIIDIHNSPITNQWSTTIDLLDYYASPGGWEKSLSLLEKISLHAPGIQNGRELIRSEFIRRNMIDFWWLTSFQ
jgi:hypothetical protein